MTCSEAYSQPYYYYFKYNPTYDVPGYGGDIYRFNLADNSNELFATNIGRVTGIVFANSDQTKILVQERSSLLVMDVSTKQMSEVLYPIDEVTNVIGSPQIGRYYLFIDSADEEYEKTMVISNTTMQPIDSINYGGENIFLSRDGKYLYQFIPDSTGIFFSRFVLSNKQSQPSTRCGSLGPFPTDVLFSDAKNGLALVNYENNTKYDFSGLEYILCDIDRNVTFAPLNFPWRSEAYLSSDGKYAIIEQVNYDTTRTSGEYHTGIVYVFDASTGELAQRLSLPPGGKILVFDNYPQTFYYYNDSTNQSVPITATTVMPLENLLDTLISLKHQAVTNSWLINKPQHEKDEDDDNADDGIVERLDRRLDKAKDALTKNDSLKARLELELFVKKIEQLYHVNKEEGERHGVQVLTSEGYALLKYNAEYLIDRLPQRQGEKDHDDKEQHER